MPPSASRGTVLFSVGALSLALVVGAWALRDGRARPGAPKGRCEVRSTASVTTDPADRPLSVARGPSLTWALVGAASATAGRVRVRAVRLPDEGAAEVIYTGEAPSYASVSGLVRTREGAAFAIARGRDVVAYELGATGVARERPFPRGESPAGRDAHGPALTLAAHDDALHALARWPAPWGARLLTTRDVRERGPWLPPRDDRFEAPDLAVLDDVVLLAQARVAGAFPGADRAAARAVELVVMDASPATPEVRAALTLAADASHPRVARVDGSRGAVAWRAGERVAVGVVAREGASWRAGGPTSLGDVDEAVVAHDLAAAPCGVVVAWSNGARLGVATVDPAGARPPSPVARQLVTRPSSTPRLRVAAAGARVVVATDTEHGAAAYEVSLDASCAPTLTELPLPWRAAGERLAGLASSTSRVVMATTAAAHDAPESALRFATFAAAGGAATASPAATTVAQGVSELTMFAGDVPVVVGRARGSVMLFRVGDPSDDGEPGEDLLLRAMRGEALAVDASAARHRVWVADVEGGDATPFGPPHGVVVHSAIDTLEDGPRTEVRPATVPEARFARVTWERAGSRWAATWSATEGDGCVPGAWASLYDAGDDRAQPLPEAPAGWPGARPLVPAAQRACGDRVQSASWRDTSLAAVVTGARGGASLVVGDVTASTPLRSTSLGASVRAASVARTRDGMIVVWLEGSARSPALRYRVFDDVGAARGEAVTLGEVAEAPGDARPDDGLPFAGGAGLYAAMFRSSHGPRVARMACGE